MGLILANGVSAAADRHGILTVCGLLTAGPKGLILAVGGSTASLSGPVLVDEYNIYNIPVGLRIVSLKLSYHFLLDLIELLSHHVIQIRLFVLASLVLLVFCVLQDLEIFYSPLAEVHQIYFISRNYFIFLVLQYLLISILPILQDMIYLISWILIDQVHCLNSASECVPFDRSFHLDKSYFFLLFDYIALSKNILIKFAIFKNCLSTLFVPKEVLLKLSSLSDTLLLFYNLDFRFFTSCSSLLTTLWKLDRSSVHKLNEFVLDRDISLNVLKSSMASNFRKTLSSRTKEKYSIFSSIIKDSSALSNDFEFCFVPHYLAVHKYLPLNLLLILYLVRHLLWIKNEGLQIKLIINKNKLPGNNCLTISSEASNLFLNIRIVCSELH
ncbi:hypothetical protein AGLY_012486, partial [Aphis glycines]